jgi:hypothetical protein
MLHNKGQTTMAVHEFKLGPEEKPKYIYRYQVDGIGIFPFDMLRYDSAWPFTQEDVMKITEIDHREIQLCSYRKPTVTRWASFNWRVK